MELKGRRVPSSSPIPVISLPPWRSKLSKSKQQREERMVAAEDDGAASGGGRWCLPMHQRGSLAVRAASVVSSGLGGEAVVWEMPFMGVCNGKGEQIELYNAHTATTVVVVTDNQGKVNHFHHVGCLQLLIIMVLGCFY
ncbi:uncharacterized protein [Lolium perenne]|uniref:uncharacterized protein n=1 Tax=Lolium perenne TaxID=4522 RepID=UPI003A99E3E3